MQRAGQPTPNTPGEPLACQSLRLVASSQTARWTMQHPRFTQAPETLVLSGSKAWTCLLSMALRLTNQQLLRGHYSRFTSWASEVEPGRKVWSQWERGGRKEESGQSSSLRLPFETLPCASNAA